MTKQRFVAATRTEKVNAFKVMDVLERARALQAGGRDIIHLEVGEPDFTTAPAIVEAGVHALQQGRTAYTGAAGLPELRERIAAFYQEQHGVRMDARRVLITPGASGALTLLANLLLNPGDRVLMVSRVDLEDETRDALVSGALPSPDHDGDIVRDTDER